MAAEAGGIDEAMALAKQAEFDVAILDVNLNGQPITPVVEILVQRGAAVRVRQRLWRSAACRKPIARSPTLQKPFQAEALAQALAAVAPKAGRLIFAQLNSSASRVMVGSSVMSSLSGVTAMQRSSSAARSVPCVGFARHSGAHRRSSNRDCRGRPGARRYAAAPGGGGPAS